MNDISKKQSSLRLGIYFLGQARAILGAALQQYKEINLSVLYTQVIVQAKDC